MYTIVCCIHLGKTQKRVLFYPLARSLLLDPVTSDGEISVCILCLPSIASCAHFPSHYLALLKNQCHGPLKYRMHTLSHSFNLVICSLKIRIMSFHVCLRDSNLTPWVARAVISIMFLNAGCSKAWIGYHTWIVSIPVDSEISVHTWFVLISHWIAASLKISLV